MIGLEPSLITNFNKEALTKLANEFETVYEGRYRPDNSSMFEVIGPEKGMGRLPVSIQISQQWYQNWDGKRA